MTKINLPFPECNRTGTGNIFNLIMRMAVVVVTVVVVVLAATLMCPVGELRVHVGVRLLRRYLNGRRVPTLVINFPGAITTLAHTHLGPTT